MIISTKEFKKVCSVVLAATSTSEISTLTETLELKTVGNALYLNVTNREYYASVRFDLAQEEPFHASVNANLFLKLIAAMTSENIELSLHDNYVWVKGNGKYKIPLIFENDTMLEVPPIRIENKTMEMDLSADILESIVNYNTKELLGAVIAKPVQKMFYIDQEGCITFTSIGACVNNFSLEKPVRILLNNKLVNLFKLFKGTSVHFSLGYDAISDTLIQTKVAFQTDTITLTAITGCDDALLNQVPAKAIRMRVNKNYPNKVVLSAVALAQALDRLLIFSSSAVNKQNIKPYSVFEFDANAVTIYDFKKENTEELVYQNGTSPIKPYIMTLNLNQFKHVLDGCTEQYITLNFGDHEACLITRGKIQNVISEVRGNL